MSCVNISGWNSTWWLGSCKYHITIPIGFFSNAFKWAHPQNKQIFVFEGWKVDHVDNIPVSYLPCWSWLIFLFLLSLFLSYYLPIPHFFPKRMFYYLCYLFCYCASHVITGGGSSIFLQSFVAAEFNFVWCYFFFFPSPYLRHSRY